MRPIVARGITYAVLAGMAWAALQVTPPVARKPGDILTRYSATLVSAAGLPHWTVPTVAVTPVVVHAVLLNGPDTVALSGTIHSSLMASLEHIGDGELPKGQRLSVAWRLADIFEYRIDMSRDLNEGDKFHILVERLQQPSGRVVVNKILGAQLSLGHRVFEAIRFKSRDSNGEWFDGKGRSLTASFLR